MIRWKGSIIKITVACFAWNVSENQTHLSIFDHQVQLLIPREQDRYVTCVPVSLKEREPLTMEKEIEKVRNNEKKEKYAKGKDDGKTNEI